METIEATKILEENDLDVNVDRIEIIQKSKDIEGSIRMIKYYDDCGRFNDSVND